MWPLLLGALALWVLSRHRRDTSIHVARERAGYGPSLDRFYRQQGRGLALLSSPRVVTTADYLRHLYEATAAARVLDTVKPLALAGDVDSLTRAPHEVEAALDVLAAPMDVIIAQKHLNALGASPPLAEDGVMGPATIEAVKSIQARFRQVVTGDLDGPTTVAIRYSVGCIHAQDLG